MSVVRTVTGEGTADDPFVPTVTLDSIGPVKARLDQYLDVAGDGSGNKVANGDYDPTAEIFYIQPAAGQIFRLHRMMVFLQDTGAFDSDKYGNGLALTNGITVRVQDDSGTLFDLTAGLPIKTNTHWARNCYDADVKQYGTGDETLAVRWTFSKDSGSPLRLIGDNNERLEVVLNDDFSDLVDHTFFVKGYIE